MADRFPIIIESTEQQIQELSAGDGLDLTRSGVVNANYVHSAGVNAGVVTATSFIGDGSQITNIPAGGGSLEATASGTLADGSTVLVNADGTVSAVGETTENYWFAMLSQGSYDSARGGAVDSSGNVYVCGRSDSSAFVVKYNSSGSPQWKRTINSSSSDYAEELVLDSSGNIYVAGYSTSGGQGGVEAFIIKYNNSGTVQWSRYFGISVADTAGSIAIDSSDNIYIVGTNELGAPTYTREASLAKFNSSGTLLWERELTSSGNNTQGVSVAVDSSDNPVICGNTNALGQGGFDIYIAKYNSSGTIQWQKSFGGSSGENAGSIAIDSSDNIYIGGYTQSEGAGAQDTLVAKFNSSGDLQWQRILGAYDTDTWGVTVDDDGNVYGLGYSSREPANTGLVGQFIMAKYNSSGDLQWQRHFGGTAGDYVFGSTASGDGDLYVFGSTGNSVSNGVEDAITLKVPGDGTLTGTHGSFTYGTSTWTAATSNLTAATSTLTDQAGARISSDASSSFTFSSSTISDSLTSIGTGTKTNLTSENYIGISDGAYTNGQTATIQIAGSVDDAQSGLTPGQQYYVQGDGTLSETADSPSVLAGTAIAATKLAIG